jgi:hypothetical protein
MYVLPSESFLTAAVAPTLNAVGDTPAGPVVGPPPAIVVIVCALTETQPKIKQARAHRAKRTEFFIDIAFLRWTLSETLIYFCKTRDNCGFFFARTRISRTPKKTQ